MSIREIQKMLQREQELRAQIEELKQQRDAFELSETATEQALEAIEEKMCLLLVELRQCRPFERYEWQEGFPVLDKWNFNLALEGIRCE